MRIVEDDVLVHTYIFAFLLFDSYKDLLKTTDDSLNMSNTKNSLKVTIPLPKYVQTNFQYAQFTGGAFGWCIPHLFFSMTLSHVMYHLTK